MTQEERVRRLLAEVHRDPADRMPPQVVDRLDAVLADLAHDREPPGRTGDEAAPGAGGAGRRRWPRVLVAAAAVCVVGLGVTGLLELSGSFHDEPRGVPAAQRAAQRSAQPSAHPGLLTQSRRSTQGSPGPRVLVPPPPPLGAATADATTRAPGNTSRRSRPPRLHSGTLRSEVRQVAAAAGSGPGAEPFAPRGTRANARAGTPSGRGPGLRCRLPALPPHAAAYAVLLDGNRAVLVLHRPGPDGRPVDVYACGDPGRRLAHTRVAAR